MALESGRAPLSVRLWQRDSPGEREQVVPVQVCCSLLIKPSVSPQEPHSGDLIQPSSPPPKGSASNAFIRCIYD